MVSNVNEIVPRQGCFKRLIHIFISPMEAFEDIKIDPKPLAPLLLLVLVTTVGILAFYYKLDINPHLFWQKVIEMSLEKEGKSFADLSPDQREVFLQQIDWYTNHNWEMTLLPTIVYNLLLPIVTSFFFFGGTLLLISNIRYLSILSIVSYGLLATGIVQVIVMLIVISLRPPELDAVINRTYLVTNLALLTAVDSPVLNVLLAQFDLFTIWWLILSILGIKKLSGRLGWQQAASVVVTPWLLWVTIRVVLSYLFKN